MKGLSKKKKKKRKRERRLTDTNSNMVIARGKDGRGEVEEGIGGINGDVHLRPT